MQEEAAQLEQEEPEYLETEGAPAEDLAQAAALSSPWHGIIRVF